jgi:hypothetical protein
MESMAMKQHPCMTLHFCSESPRIGPFEEPKTEVVDTPDERGRHHTWALGPAALIWQCILTKPLSGAGEFAITGLSNGSTLTLLSGNLAFPVNSTINTVTRVGMTIV